MGLSQLGPGLRALDRPVVWLEAVRPYISPDALRTYVATLRAGSAGTVSPIPWRSVPSLSLHCV